MIFRQTWSYFACVALIATGNAHAGLLNPTGAVSIVIPPSDVSEGAFESNTEIRAFAERQNVLLTEDLLVNILNPGTSPDGDGPNLSPGDIPSGTRVSSYLLHFDTLEPSPDPIMAVGTISFSTDILGIIVNSGRLSSTDSVVGLSELVYPGGGNRGLEFNLDGGGLDSITLSEDRRTVSVTFRNNQATDQVRVITVVPEPSSLVILAMGTAGIFCIGLVRRRRDARSPAQS